MKEILCYGDSNTWGFTPTTGARYPYAVRWPGALGALLGSGCRITENGVNGRTTVFNDPDFPCRNGKTGLGYALCAGKPFDLVILMLGTNDLKFTDAAGAARGAAELVALLQNANARDGRFPAGSEDPPRFAVAHRRKCRIRGTLFQPGRIAALCGALQGRSAGSGGILSRRGMLRGAFSCGGHPSVAGRPCSACAGAGGKGAGDFSRNGRITPENKPPAL